MYEYEYWENGKEVHRKYSNGWEAWYEYDGHGKQVHRKGPGGWEEWCEYDGRGKEIHRKDSDGWEEWHDYDERGKEIRCTICFFGCKDEFWYEYDYYDDGTVRRCTEYRTLNEPLYALSPVPLEILRLLYDLFNRFSLAVGRVAVVHQKHD